jgi:hypothetical protein
MILAHSSRFFATAQNDTFFVLAQHQLIFYNFIPAFMKTIFEEESGIRHKIPAYLIKEEIEGEPFYYKGFEAVLTGDKTLGEIMGSSVLQTLLAGLILRYLGKYLPENLLLGTNEAGLHIGTNNNFSNDIALYAIEEIKNPFSTQYFDFPPKVVIEIDMDAESGEKDFFLEDMLTVKTQKMLDFGVQKVIWILTKSRKILVATPDKDWIITNWDSDITVYENTVLNLNQLLKDNRII